MDEQQPKPESAADSDTRALSEIVDAKRKALGYDVNEPKSFAAPQMPIRELLPEQVAAREQFEAQQALARQKSERQGMFAKLVQSTGNRYSDCTLEAYEARTERQKAAVTTIREYVGSLLERLDSSEGLILYGPAGTGKDHLAFFVAAVSILSYGRNAMYVNGQDWFGDLRDGMDSGAKERTAIDRLAWCPVLILSDPLPPFGNLTQHQASMLYRLVHSRYANGRVTICTINVADDAEADERLGVQTWDRLCDRAWKIHCNWPSYRKPARIVNGK